jgi:arylsulfatase A-like enzyme
VLVRANHPDTDGPGWFYAGWGEVFDARPQEEDHSPLDALVRSLPGLLDRLAAGPDFLLWVEIDRLLPPWDVRPDVFEAYFLDEEEEPEAGDTEDDEDDETEAVTDQSSIPNPKSQIPPWSDPPTGPFAADPEAREWLYCSFAAVVTSLDAELGKVFDRLRGRGLDQSAAWLVTSDFGYPLGEHGQIGLHRPRLHEELVHLPLILRLPGAAEEGRRVHGFTQPPDLAPTLLSLFGLTAEGVAGFDLLPLARGEAESVRPHAITSLELNGVAEAAIRTADWALLLPTRVPDGETRDPQLYEKPDDRWEVNDLRRANIERADELEAEIKKAATDEHG